MKSFWNNRRMTFGIIILLSIVLVFFFGRSFNKDTLKREATLTLDGLSTFRRGLDISGGTKLTYRIAYDKYEETYKDAMELASVKQTVENIILRNIDGRISKLGVSDYKSYTQQLNNETQLIVEIGGVIDLDQAKEIIGKTVELEFKLPNEKSGDAEARAALAQKLHDDIVSNPNKMSELTEGRGSENIFYTLYEEANLTELPLIYQAHMDTLSALAAQEGAVSEVLEGVYGNVQAYDEQGELMTETLNGHVFFRILGTQSGVRSNVGIADIVEVAAQLNLPYPQDLTILSDSQGIASGAYVIREGTLLYNNGELYPNQEAYDMRILAVMPLSTLGLTGEEISQQEADFAQRIEEIKAELAINPEANFDDAGEVHNAWIGVSEVQQAIPSFTSTNVENIQSHSTDDFAYVMVIRERKAANQQKFTFLEIENVNSASFEEALQSKTTYTIEEVFVQDRLSWTTAQTSDGKILNGANFKYASVSSSQIWQPVVVLSFDEVGKEIFCNITTNHIGKQMAIFIGGEIITAPVIQSKICDGSAQIDGQFTPESAKELTSSLNNGALPAPLILMQEEKVSPSLGESAFSGAILAMLAGLILIYVYMTIVYGFRKGLISLLSLSIFTLTLLAIVKVIDYALSLAGIAAIILSIGMAVDTNILIFERMKEEKSEGKSDDTAIRIAYERSRAAIKDAQLSTGLIGLLLFMMGINMFKGFGSMLVIGVILTLLINVPLIKELLFILYPSKEKGATK